MEKREREERRAVNQIWNAAGDYSIKPEYVALDEEECADFYFNNIIGAVYRCYEYDRLAQLFHSFRQKQDGPLYEDLLWIGLENGVFGRVRRERTAMEELRREYAWRTLEKTSCGAGQELIRNIRAGHCMRILGQEAALSSYEKNLLDAIEFSPELSTSEIVQQMSRVMSSFFGKTIWELDEMGSTWFSRRKFLALPKFGRRSGIVRLLSIGEGEKADKSSFLSRNKQLLEKVFLAKPDEQAVRAYVEGCFGESAYEEKEREEMERLLCTENHNGCYLHITKGRFSDTGELKGEAKWQREETLRQEAVNLAYFQEHITENKITITRLTEKIRNALLLCQEPSEEKSRYGELYAGKVWRGLYLHDDAVFRRTDRNRMENLSVDLLLDGSASQKEQQEKLAAQAYIITESLTRCQIPVRVTSFCSVSGCTVLQILRGYQDCGGNSNIFKYRAAGWNRDGLGIRILGHLMEEEQCENRMLILLSDASPNDDQKIIRENTWMPGKEYGGETGVEDTAAEVLRLKRLGIRVLCIFTGGDRELPAARKIYGKDLVKLPSIGWFADTVGKLIQDRIREML